MAQAQPKTDLITAMEALVHDPLGFVKFSYRWNEGVLKGEYGPDEWQEEVLREIGNKSRSIQEALLIAVKKGHGVGGTALAAWIIHWFMSTRPHPQVVVTANTRNQLDTKTWRELAKWHKLSLHEDWFEWTATKFYLKQHPDTWFASAIPWSKEKSEAFAGTHEKHVLVVFDEGSAIDDIIYEVTEGAMTTPGAIWCVFGNPTRNTGRFRECWGRFRHRWITFTVDARKAKKANQEQIKAWIEDYGEDSDFVRIRVTGEFPRASAMQLIPVDLVETAMHRRLEIRAFEHLPIVLGVDVARFGDDQSVILVRQGGHIAEILKVREKDTMQIVGLVTEFDQKYKPQSIFVDEVGVGAAVVDRLRNLGYTKVVGVTGSRKPTKEKIYHNLRTEMWCEMKEWLKTGSLPDDQELLHDLIAPEYYFDSKNRMALERKEDIKKRGLASPDTADALAMTFALPVYTKSDIEIQQEMIRRQQSQYVPLNPDGGY